MPNLNRSRQVKGLLRDLKPTDASNELGDDEEHGEDGAPLSRDSDELGADGRDFSAADDDTPLADIPEDRRGTPVDREYAKDPAARLARTGKDAARFGEKDPIHDWIKKEAEAAELKMEARARDAAFAPFEKSPMASADIQKELVRLHREVAELKQKKQAEVDARKPKQKPDDDYKSDPPANIHGAP